MQCEDVQRALSLEEGDERRRSELRAHAATCAACQRFAAWSKMIDAVVHQAPEWESSPAIARTVASRALDEIRRDATRHAPFEVPVLTRRLPGPLTIVLGALEQVACSATGMLWMLRQYWSLVMSPFGLTPRR